MQRDCEGLLVNNEGSNWSQGSDGVQGRAGRDSPSSAEVARENQHTVQARDKAERGHAQRLPQSAYSAGRDPTFHV
jgi:hypothetical protein